VERVFDKSNLETAKIPGCMDMQIRAIASQNFSEYRLPQMAHGQELFWTAPDLKLQDAFTRPSMLVLLDLMRSRGAVPFHQRLSGAASHN
jgi:hypothetical protein